MIKPNRFNFILLIIMSAYSAISSSAQWPEISLDRLSLSPVKTVVIPNDPVFDKTKTYRAIRLLPVIQKLQNQYNGNLSKAVLVFTAADGYRATMAYPDALNKAGYLAFQDMEASDGKWIHFKFGDEMISPAPFYLIWSDVSKDNWRYPWPFQLTKITLQPASSYFDKAVPVSAVDSVVEGFTLFTRFCIRCHAINNSGGHVGPELNSPINVTELFDTATLKKIILNAPAFRKNTKMPDFRSMLNRHQLDQIAAYLKAMKSQKIIAGENKR